MGSFFTSVQVRGRAAAGVVEALRALAAADGLAPTEDAASADRSILVLAGADGWVSVYDEASEGQDQRRLDRLASALSSASAAEAVTILVHDGDVLELRLFRAGALVDRFNSAPSYFGEVSAREKKEAAGKAELWAPVLAKGATVGDLRAAFGEDKLFAGSTLQTIAKLLGIDADRAQVGYNYADKSDPRLVALRFRLAERPAYETPAAGAPRFEMGAHSPEMDISADFPVQIGCSVRNVGGAGKGLRVVAWGEALERGLVVLDSIELVVGVPQEAKRLTAPLVDGEAVFEDLAIPAGRGGDLSALMADPKKMIQVMYASQVHANLYGKGGAKGEGELHVGFVPTSAPDGQYAHTMLLRAHAAPRRPLRAPADAPAHVLRPLEGRATLFALASMDLDRAAAAAVATRLVERWATDWGRSPLAYTVFRSDPGARPRNGKARWDAIVRDFAGEHLVTGAGGKSGFSFGGSILPREAAGDPELPTIALWSDGDEALATELMDEVMTKHRGVQAMVGRWDWSPSYGLETTPYETACGIGGQCTLHRSWLRRFVRGVAVGTLWLGEGLREQVPDAPPRIAVDDASIDAVEAMLAPVLPTQDDWRRGIDRLYGR